MLDAWGIHGAARADVLQRLTMYATELRRVQDEKRKAERKHGK